MKSNEKATSVVGLTHEGGAAGRQTALTELTRAVSTCLLWENTFYEKGNDIATRIAELCQKVSSDELAALAVRCRTDLKLRHVPLFLARQLTKLHKGSLVGDTIANIVQRPDELGEFLSLYFKTSGKSKRNHGKGEPLSAQVKKGLARAFTKFNAYQLAKWNRDSTVKLRDVLFLTHAKPRDAEQAALWKQLVDNTLPIPDTWEVALSTGKDKKATWERLLREKHLGYIALLMNLRNMLEVGVDHWLVENALRSGAAKSRALPFRFISAAKAAPGFANALSEAMISVVHGKLPGSTILVVDVSGSMNYKLSEKSQLTRMEAGGALAILLREVCESIRVITFSDQAVEVPNYRGLPLMNAIQHSQAHASTHLRDALRVIKKDITGDRIIVVTDEQTHDGIEPAWLRHNYLVNVAPYRPGLDVTQNWKRVSGWSERIVDWIAFEETGRLLDNNNNESKEESE